MYRILVRNRTDHTLSLCATTSIRPGMGRMVARTHDIIQADRLVAIAGLAAVMDFPSEQRSQFIVTATEYGCEIDHPEHGRISVTIFDPQPRELGMRAAVGDGASAACG